MSPEYEREAMQHYRKTPRGEGIEFDEFRFESAEAAMKEAKRALKKNDGIAYRVALDRVISELSKA